MKKQIILLVTILLIPFTYYGQNFYPNRNISQIVLESTLVVEINEENSDTDQYVNKAIKDIFTNNWKFSKVLFKTNNEIKEFKTEVNKGYSFLTSKDAKRTKIRTNHISADGRVHAPLVGSTEHSNSFYNSAYNKNVFVFSYYVYKLETYKDGKLVDALKIGLANNELTKIDYLYVCQQLENLLESSAKNIPKAKFYNVQKNIEQIKNSKLIIPENYFREKDLKKISKFYDYEFEIVDSEEYQNIILNKTNKCVYPKIIWSPQIGNYVWILVDSSNGKTKAITGFGGIKFGKNQKVNAIIKAKQLKHVTKTFTQNHNNKYKK